MKGRTLLGLFIILATIYGLTKLFSGKQALSFSANLVEIDTAQVTSILLTQKGHASEVSLLREGNNWIASNGQINVKAQTEAVQNLLRVLTHIPTNQIVAKKQEQWARYAVDEKQGVQVRVYHDRQLLADFVLGNPSSPSATCFLRLSGEKEVYAVDTLLAMRFEQDFNAFRNKNLLKIAAGAEVTAFDYQIQDSTFQFIKTKEGWKNGATTLDSMQVENYINVLRNVIGENFADDFDEVQGSKYLYKTLTIKAQALEEPLIITCYRDTTRQPSFILQSNQNPESFFASDSTGIYYKVFNKVNGFRSQKPEARSQKSEVRREQRDSL